MGCAITGVLAVFRACPGYAQNAGNHPADQVQLNEVVVTAEKRKEVLKDVPIAMSVLSGEQLDRQPIGGVAAALSHVAGISLETTALSGGQEISIRGVAANGPFLSGGGTTAYYVDDVPFAFVKTSVVPDLNAYDMERVEVLRGPQGTLYGASALNGVVRILTNDPDLSTVDFKGRVSIANTQGGGLSYGGDVAANLPLVTDTLALRVVAGADHTGGWISQPMLGVSDANQGHDSTIRLKLKGDPTKNLWFELESWTNRTQQGAANFSDKNYIQLTPVETPQHTSYDIYGAKVGYEFPAISIRSNTGYVDYATDSITPAAVTPPLVLTSGLKSREFSEEVLINSDASGNWSWSAGTFYRNARDGLFQTLPGVLPAPVDFADESRSYAAYGQITRSFWNKHLKISAGLRDFHDQVSQVELTPLTGLSTEPLINVTKDFSALTPRVTLTVIPNRDYTLYASYSQGFRSGYNQSPLALRTDSALPAVDADTLNNYEIGSKGRLLGGLVSFDTAVYYMDWKNIQEEVVVLLPGSSVGAAAAINGSSATGWGTDLGVTVHPAPIWQIGGTLSWNNLALVAPLYSAGTVLIPAGARPGGSAEWTGDVFTDLTHSIGQNLGVTLSASVNYISKTPYYRVGAPVTRSDAPLIARLSLAFLVGSRWTTTLFIDNALNWNGYLTPPTVDSNIVQQPRTYGVMLEYRP